jgi:hypothetical protein
VARKKLKLTLFGLYNLLYFDIKNTWNTWNLVRYTNFFLYVRQNEAELFGYRLFFSVKFKFILQNVRLVTSAYSITPTKYKWSWKKKCQNEKVSLLFLTKIKDLHRTKMEFVEIKTLIKNIKIKLSKSVKNLLCFVLENNEILLRYSNFSHITLKIISFFKDNNFNVVSIELDQDGIWLFVLCK